MIDARLEALRNLIQDDVNARGLGNDPAHNLINACPHDFAAACRSLAQAPRPHLAVVTGFFIPTARPPAAETDGPLGALFLARALTPLGIKVTLLAEEFCASALEAGLAASEVADVGVLVLEDAATAVPGLYARRVFEALGPVSHLLAIERVGPSHTSDAVPPEHRDRCHTMRGRDVTALMSPAHHLFETTGAWTTIGIGDGGNEIGMGKIAWDVIARNIPNGGLIACRIPTDHLIVCGVSNWGAYALSAGVALVRGQALDPRLCDAELEHEILQTMVQHGPLVDGVSGRQVATVDALAWDRYAQVLTRIGAIVAGAGPTLA